MAIQFSIGQRVRALEPGGVIEVGETGTIAEIRDQLILVAWDRDKGNGTRMFFRWELEIVEEDHE